MLYVCFYLIKGIILISMMVIIKTSVWKFKCVYFILNELKPNVTVRLQRHLNFDYRQEGKIKRCKNLFSQAVFIKV